MSTEDLLVLFFQIMTKINEHKFNRSLNNETCGR